jgi:hypothetical protein
MIVDFPWMMIPSFLSHSSRTNSILNSFFFLSQIKSISTQEKEE